MFFFTFSTFIFPDLTLFILFFFSNFFIKYDKHINPKMHTHQIINPNKMLTINIEVVHDPLLHRNLPFGYLFSDYINDNYTMAF